MLVKVLVENTSVSDYYENEHGLSLYIEVNGRKILFDMGQTDMFIRNAEKMGVNLENVDIAILSHGHYDHGGGLEHFLKLNRRAQVYVSRYAFEPHYNGSEKYIGLDTSLQNSERIIFTEGEVSLGEGLTLNSLYSSDCKYPIESYGLNMIKDGEFVPDDFRHEQYLNIEEDGYRTLISGCSHKGILNIVNKFKPDVLIGGFHFTKLSPTGDGREVLISSAEELSSYNTRYYTCHCTGTEQFEFLKGYMEDKLHYISCGVEMKQL